MMNDTRVMSMEELQVFLRSSGSLKFNGYSRTEAYAWIEKTLRQYHYLTRPRAEKGLLRQYLRKMSGYPLVDSFGTFEWPRASDLKELVVGSRV